MNSQHQTAEPLEKTMEVQFVLPSLKISGGILEAIKLAEDIGTAGGSASILYMWRSSHAVLQKNVKVYSLSDWATRIPNALARLPQLLLRFRRLVKVDKKRSNKWMFTHYSTLPLALLVPPHRRFIFVQGLEWLFLNNALLSQCLKRFIMFVYRRSQLIAANPYLEKALRRERLVVRGVAPIWADSVFDQPSVGERDIDILMVLRKGGCKRIDLYLEVLKWFTDYCPAVRIAVITTEDDIAQSVRDKVAECHLRPAGRREMVALYSRSKILLHLSDHEGFALPPLEAMGCGCVPICRDSGGPQAYMVRPLDTFLLSPDEVMADLCVKTVELLNDAKQWQSLSTSSQRIFRQGLFIAQQRANSLMPLFSDSLLPPLQEEIISAK